MNNSTLAKKVKELRMSAGSSQEELAEKTQLNLRTIQRIESGETQPRGDSLKRLALALGVTTQELVGTVDTEVCSAQDEDIFAPASLPEDKGFLTILHLSALSFLLFPGFLLLPAMGILVPLILWVLKKDKIRGVRETGKKILNFQISWFLLFTVVFGNAAVTKILHIDPFFGHLTTFRILIALYLYNVITIIINIVRLGKDQSVVYQPAIPFVRIHPSAEGQLSEHPTI